MDHTIEDTPPMTKRSDRGFTLIELLIVIVIMGILATVTVFAVRGVTGNSQDAACKSDKATLETAAETYFANYSTKVIATGTYAAQTLPSGSTQPGYPAVTTAVPSPSTNWTAGATPNASLVNAQLIRSAPSTYFVASDGSLYVLDSKCGAVGNKAS